MNNLKKILSLLLLAALILGCLSGCGGQTVPTDGPTDPAQVQTDPPARQNVDYAASVKLDMSSKTAKQEVTVKQYIDGDTTHFYVPTSVMPNGVLKARYLAVNTPESTGKIEEFGKKASNFTKEKLASAYSIIIESDTEKWDADSTGDRYLVWIWYQTEKGGEYRNLNIELLQEGLAIASSSSENQYGPVCMDAIAQAKANKLNVHSGEKDPDFYYGDAIELTLKELRANIEEYTGMRVAFNAVVTKYNNNGIYVEQYDAEDDMYYGIYIYYGFNLSSKGLEIISLGNEVRFVGSLQFYEAGGTYQLADLSYRSMNPDDPKNIKLLSTGNEPAFVLTDPKTFATGKVDVMVNEELKTFPYAEMAMGTTVSMNGLKVNKVYTTDSDTASKGAMTLTCKADGYTITVRTAVLYDEDGNLITADAYKGKTIDVRGVVDYFSGDYQIKVFSANDIVVH